jgi:hypothetical protein
MTIAIAAWVCYLLWLILGFGTADRTRPYWYGYPVLLAIIVGLILWHDFGPPIH